jgi:dihydrofolate reductase
LTAEDCPGATVTADPAATLAEIRSRPGKDIWLFGGGDLFRSLLALGLVDEVEVAIVPVLLGGGLPLLPSPAARASLRLIRQRHFEKTGTMLLEYAVNVAQLPPR